MRVISKKKLRAFWEKHKTAEQPLQNWYRVVSKMDWRTFAGVRATFNSADLVGECVVFNVGGNNWRLIVTIRYEVRKVFVLKVMDHKEYDKRNWMEECGCERRV